MTRETRSRKVLAAVQGSVPVELQAAADVGPEEPRAVVGALVGLPIQHAAPAVEERPATRQRVEPPARAQRPLTGEQEVVIHQVRWGKCVRSSLRDCNICVAHQGVLVCAVAG